MSSPKVLPVTLLSGFLGAGKTTLLNNILRNTQDLRVAVIVNDMGSVNIDAALIKQSVGHRHEHDTKDAKKTRKKDEVVQLQNGCICCTLREDLLVEIKQLAQQGQFDYLVIESSGISEPLPVAETFTFDVESAGLASSEPDSDSKKRGRSGQQDEIVSLMDIAKLDTTVTVVDSASFFDNLSSIEAVIDRDPSIDQQDNRSIAHLLLDQVEFADVIILNKMDLMTAVDMERLEKTISSLNPGAKLIRSVQSSVPLTEILNTGRFSFKNAAQNAGWLRELRGQHVPETLEYGISSFVYRARRPFHSSRLFSLLDDSFMFNNETAHEQMQRNRHQNSALSGALRSKGFLWLSSSHDRMYDWSQAGRMLTFTPGVIWFANVHREKWNFADEEDTLRVLQDFQEPFGDRRQEIVFIGQSLDAAAVTTALDACLLTDEEFAQHPHKWPLLAPNPFDSAGWEAADELYESHLYHGAIHEYLAAARNTVPGETVKVLKYFAETLGAVEMIYSCYAADESAFGPATDTVLRALAGNLEYLKPVVAEGDQNEEDEFNEELEPGLTFLDGANIIHHPHGAKHALDDLRALDLVGIYFSAHWCPPCRKFTPQLAEVYKEIAAAGKKFGVVFVSSDRDEESFREYFRKMPWVALDYAQRDLQESLSETFRVEGIPTLVLADPKTGKLSVDGMAKVALGAAAFPWPL